MKEKQRIVIAEDHTILREGLRALLTADPGFDVVGEAEDGRDAVRCVENHLPDLVLMDLSLPRMNGMDAIRKIKRRCPETKGPSPDGSQNRGIHSRYPSSRC